MPKIYGKVAQAPGGTQGNSLKLTRLWSRKENPQCRDKGGWCPEGGSASDRGQHSPEADHGALAEVPWQEAQEWRKTPRETEEGATLPWLSNNGIFKNFFYFEIIIDIQEVAKIVQRGAAYPSPSLPP